MPKFTGHITATPAEIASALSSAKEHLPLLAPLKSLSLKNLTGEVDAVYTAPLIGDVAIDATLAVDENG